MKNNLTRKLRGNAKKTNISRPNNFNLAWAVAALRGCLFAAANAPGPCATRDCASNVNLGRYTSCTEKCKLLAIQQIVLRFELATWYTF